MSEAKQYGWECGFCSERLKQQSLVGWRRLLWFVPIRTFRCPHCFQLFRKPVAFVSMIPIIGTMFCEKRGGTAAVSGIISVVARKRRRRTYAQAGMLVRLAHFVEIIESKLSDALDVVMRTFSLVFLRPFRWVSKRLHRSTRDPLTPLTGKTIRRTRVRRNNG